MDTPVAVTSLRSFTPEQQVTGNWLSLSRCTSFLEAFVPAVFYLTDASRSRPNKCIDGVRFWVESNAAEVLEIISQDADDPILLEMEAVEAVPSITSSVQLQTNKKIKVTINTVLYLHVTR